MSTEVTVEFVDELPTIKRSGRESGVWAERLEPLREPENLMRWAKVYGPTKNPHAVIANVQNGSVAGVPDAERFEFAGRTLPTGEVDEDGNEVREGYVFARLMDEDRQAEREQELAEKRAKREARQAEAETEVEF